MDEQTLQRILTAAMSATQQNQTQQVQSLKKPDLPNFDKRNIEIWIKRVESAFTRVNCTDPKLKFAHLEAKFEVGEDPVVDEHLYGESTAERWTSLLTHFRTRYGRTKKDMALALINGVPREGRTPSQLAAAIDDKAGTVTIDDIKKQQLLKQLPPEVYRQIVDRVEALDFRQTAKLADAWFDKDGNSLISSSTTSIHNVDRQPTPQPEAASSSTHPPNSFSQPFQDEGNDTDVNAIRRQQFQKRNFNSANRGRGGNNNNNSGNNNNNNNRNNNNSRPNSSNNNADKPKNVCPYHIKYGDKAERCLDWCILYPQHQASNTRASK